MIQRIQTLYLLLVVVLTGLALWLPLVDFTVGADTCTLTAFGLKDAAGITLLPTVYLGVVLVAACLVPLVTIFLFKRRLVDPVMCRRVGAPHRCRGDDGNSTFATVTSRTVNFTPIPAQNFARFFPLVCTGFDLLALRVAIFRDEKLVRSLDRIR